MFSPGCSASGAFQSSLRIAKDARSGHRELSTLGDWWDGEGYEAICISSLLLAGCLVLDFTGCNYSGCLSWRQLHVVEMLILSSLNSVTGSV